MRRGDVTSAHGGARDTARTCVGGTTSARTTRSAALGRHDDSLAARRSLGVAGVGSERAEPAMRRGEKMRRGDVTRRTEAHTTRRARASAVRPAHARRDRRRSAGTTTRSRLGARSASSVSALREPSRRCDEESRMRRGDVTRRTAATRRGAHVRRRHDRRTHDEVGDARSARRLARGSALARRRRCRL